MTPDYALSLSFDGIALLQRHPAAEPGATGWTELGAVALDVADLQAALADLRAKAGPPDMPGPRVTLILPNEQIKYLTVPRDAGDPAEQAARALDGATPYDVADLRFDWQEQDGQLHVAAVARETLDEAESFARDNGFIPLDFAGASPHHAFGRAPVFGPTRLAADNPPGEAATATTAASGDATPTTVEAARAAPETGTADVAEAARASSAAAPKETPEADGRDAADMSPEASPRADAPSAASTAVSPPLSPTGIPEATRPVASAVNPEPPAVAFSSLRAERAPRDPAPGSAGSTGPATPDPRAEGQAPPVLATPDPDTDAAPPQEPPPSARPPAFAGTAPPSGTFAAAIKARAEALDTTRQTASPTRGTGQGRAPKPAAVPGSPDPRPADPVSAGMLARAQGGLERTVGSLGRRSAAATRAAIPVKPSAGGGAAAEAVASTNPLNEAERMTVFGARGKARAGIGGKPRFLGVLLTAALLLFLLAVAAWAALFVDDGLARFFGPADETKAEAGEAMSPAAEPSVREDAAVDPAAIEALPETTLDGSRAAVPEETFAALAPEDANLSPEEAAARYAATGIWQRAPARPAEVAQATFGDLRLASLDPRVALPEPSRLAAPDRFETDRDLPSQILPPRADQRYDFDDRGLIVPTPDGVVTPDGFRLILGAPGIVPPTRPALSIPETQPEGTEDTGAATPEADPEAPGTEAAVVDAAPLPPPVDPALAALRPVARAPAPEDTVLDEGVAASGDPVPAIDEAADTVADGTEPETSDVSPEISPEQLALAALRPLARPESIAAAAPADAVAEEAPAPATDAAVAEAPATPVPPEVPEVPTSRLAVLQSIAPEPRPGNINRIVARTERSAAPAPTAVAAVAAVTPSTVQPRAPSRQSVARAATQSNAINLRRVNLVGVYGRPSDRRALVRLANGRFQKVKVGDRLDGGRILAISDDQLRYQKGGRNVVLDLPQG